MGSAYCMDHLICALKSKMNLTISPTAIDTTTTPLACGCRHFCISQTCQLTSPAIPCIGCVCSKTHPLT